MQGEFSPTFFSSVGCNDLEPTPVADIGFPLFHMLMEVHYELGPGPPEFLRGDADGNGILNALVDAFFIIAFQFQGGPAPICMEAADVDGNGVFNGLVDARFLLLFQFVPGSPHPPCLEAADADGDGSLTGLVDGLYILNEQFVLGSPPPPPPYPDCGADPDPASSLGCQPNGCP